MISKSIGRTCSVHNWVHKADLQPEPGRRANHVAVDETVTRLDDEQYWLYAAIDPETNDLLHTQLEPATNNAVADRFFADLRGKHDIDDATVLVDGSASLQRACRRYDLDFRYERHGNRNSVERVFREINAELPVSQTVLATPKQKLLTSGSDHSLSHGISLSEHYG